MKETNTISIIEKIKENTQLFLTLTYLFAIGIGMLFNHYKYSAFNINIFDYATVFDFLIAPFADFRILLFTLITLITTYLLYLGDNYWQGHYPENYARFTFNIERFAWYTKIKRSFSLMVFVCYLFLVAQGYGKLVKDEVLSQEVTSINYTNYQIEKGQLIGKTSDMLFLYQHQEVKAIPISSTIKSIEIK